MIRTRPRFPFWFLAAIAVIPLVYSNATVDPAFTLRAVLLAILTLVTIFATRKQPLRTSPLLWIWCAYAAFNIISIFVAQNSGEAIYEASIVLLYGVWLFVAIQIVTKEFLLPLLRTIAILCFLISLISLFQYFDLGFRSFPSRLIPSATMTTRNLMSSFLFLTLPATLYVSIIEKKSWAIFGLVSSTMGIFVLLIAQTRAVWLGTTITGVVAVGLFMISGHRKALWESYHTNIRNTTIAAAACLITVFVFNYPPRIEHGQGNAVKRVGTLANYASDTSAIMRFRVWRKSLEMLRDHPILGVGAGNWKIEFPQYGLGQFEANIQQGRFQWTETHNDFLSALCETGIGGGLVYLSLFALTIVLGIRAMYKVGNPREMLLIISIVSCVCGFGIISFLDFPNARVEHSMLFLLWLAVLPAASPRKENASIRWPYYIAGILAVPALVLSLERFMAEIHEKTLLQARIDHDWSAEIDECNKIYNPRLLSVDPLSTPILYYKAEAEFMQKNYKAALRDNIMALHAHPNHFYTLNNTGSCYVKLGNFQTGEVFYKKALAISPNFQESLLNLTAVYFDHNEFDSARMFIRQCDTSVAGSRAQTYARVIFRATH